MQKKYAGWLGIMVCLILFSCTGKSPSTYLDMKELPLIFPDYSDLVIPANISPLNFIIKNEGTKFRVDFVSEKNDGFSIISTTPNIRIPIKKWKKFLNDNTNQSIQFILYIKSKEDGWQKYNPIQNQVSADRIDPYIVYRRINAGMLFWDNMAIVQRCLEDFSESDLVENQNSERNCINCHTFQNRDPQSFLLHMRVSPNGTILKTKDKTLFLNSKTQHTLSTFVYPAWHPNGRYIAFSTNKIHQNFFGHGNRLNHVRDDASDIVVYDIDSNLVFTTPKLATFDFENLPAWSPDGKFLYYIKSDYQYKLLPDTSEKYDLMRIAFDEKTKEWGDPEMRVSSKKTGMSASFPQVSPDGKYLIFCQADYGYFDINNTSSDLFLFNLSDSTYSKLPINSTVTESFPNWSENGRWIMFTTKRIDNMYTVPHFAYFDSTGVAHKPFPLPFEDPEAYLTRTTNINRPVFIKGKVEFDQNEILKTAYSEPLQVVFDSLHIQVDAIAGATSNNKTTPQTGVPYMKD
jgi:hypothetical protein